MVIALCVGLLVAFLVTAAALFALAARPTPRQMDGPFPMEAEHGYWQ